MSNWQKPQLSVLMRGTPGDGTNQTILGCKIDMQFKRHPDANPSRCVWQSGDKIGVDCEVYTQS